MNLQIIQIWPHNATSATENTSENKYRPLAVARSCQHVLGAKNLKAMLLKLIGAMIADWLVDYYVYRLA
jgi:hypothetical protein